MGEKTTNWGRAGPTFCLLETCGEWRGKRHVAAGPRLRGAPSRFCGRKAEPLQQRGGKRFASGGCGSQGSCKLTRCPGPREKASAPCRAFAASESASRPSGPRPGGKSR